MTAGPGDTETEQAGPRPDDDRAGGVRTSEEVGAARRSHSGTSLRGDIEGLRAVAVGTVLIYHVGIPFMPGGFVGVDVFFVISGFLITSLLIREASTTGRISIARFYARRARRLLPAASTVLIFTAIAGWLILPGTERANLGIDVITATLYVINWGLALRSVDYLAEDAAPSVLQHYWSLSVEEQFYVVWPLIIIFGLFLAKRTRLRPKPLVFGLLSVIAAASLVYSIVHTAADPATAYFYTTTRVWELAIGALLAFLVARLATLPKLVAELLSGVGLLLVLYAAFFFTSSTPWPGYMALVPTVGAGMVIAAGCATQSTAAGRLLGLKPMVFIGGLSYAIYLWHWPLVTLAEVAYPDIRIRYTALLGLLSIFLAWATKHLVEDPIRFHPHLGAKPSRGLLFGLATMVVTALTGTAVWASVPDLEEDARTRGATALIANPEAEDDWRVKTGQAQDEVIPDSGEVTPAPAVAPEDAPSYYDDDCQIPPGETQVDTTCVYGKTNGDKTIAMLGDSKMGQWFPAVTGIAAEENWRVELYLKSACAFSYEGEDPDCEKFAENTIEHFKEKGAPDIALVSYGHGASTELRTGSAKAVEDLEALGTEVVVIADSPRPAMDEVYTCVEEHPDNFSACTFPANEEKGREGTGTSNLEEVAERTNTPLVDLNEWICPPGDTCPPVIDDTLVYRQGSHVTATYIRTLAPMLYRALAAQDLTERNTSEITTDMIP